MASGEAAHQRDINVIADDVARQVTAVARSADVADIDAWWSRSGPGVQRTVTRASAATATLASRFLVAEALENGVPGLVPSVAVADPVRIAESLRITGPVAFKTNMARTGNPDLARRAMTSRLAGSATRLTLAGSRETIADTAEASPAIARYRRVAQSGACDFCEMLAGRGAVYTAESAGRVVGRAGRPRGNRRIGQSYHDQCRCYVSLEWDEVAPSPTPPQPPVVEPEIEPLPDPDRERVIGASPVQRVTDARQRFRDEPQVPMDRFEERNAVGYRVPTPEMFAREQLRHDVGARADEVIRERMRAGGFLTEDEARERVSEAIRRRNEAEDAWLAGSGRRGTKAHRAYVEAEQEIMDAQTALFRASEDFAKEYQAEMRGLLDELGIERGGVPARSLMTNYDQVEPGLRGRIEEGLALYPTEWLQRSTGRDGFQVIHESRRAFMREAGFGRDAQMNLAPDESVAIIVHEFGHQMENLSFEIRRAEWALYWRRVGDDELESLKDLTGGDYGGDELTRVDEWPKPYMGKPYGGAASSSNYELWSMMAERFLPDVSSAVFGTEAKFWSDEDLRQWFLGVLLTA